MTPSRRLMIASTISAVTANFGAVLRIRSMRFDWSDAALSLETLDLVPQGAVLRLVSRPDFLLRYLTEFVGFGFDHGHSDRFEQCLGLREMIDRLGLLANLFLRGARQFEDELLLISRQTVPDIEIHHGIGRAVVMIGEGGVLRDLVDFQGLHVDDRQI